MIEVGKKYRFTRGENILVGEVIYVSLNYQMFDISLESDTFDQAGIGSLHIDEWRAEEVKDIPKAPFYVLQVDGENWYYSSGYPEFYPEGPIWADMDAPDESMTHLEFVEFVGNRPWKVLMEPAKENI